MEAIGEGGEGGEEEFAADDAEVGDGCAAIRTGELEDAEAIGGEVVGGSPVWEEGGAAALEWGGGDGGEGAGAV